MDKVAVAAFRAVEVSASPATDDYDGGLAVLHTYASGGSETTELEPIPGPLDSSVTLSTACPAVDEQALFLDVPRVVISDGDSSYTDKDNYKLRLYVSFWGTHGACNNVYGQDCDATHPLPIPPSWESECALWEVEHVVTAGVASTDWTSLDYTASGVCPLAYNTVRNVQSAPWAADAAFVMGGDSSGGGVCAVATGPGFAVPPLVFGGDAIVTVIDPHPHLANTFLVGTKWDYWDSGFTMVPGVFLTNLRFNAATSTNEWVRARLDASDLENPVVEMVEWADYRDYTTELHPRRPRPLHFQLVGADAQLRRGRRPRWRRGRRALFQLLPPLRTGRGAGLRTVRRLARPLGRGELLVGWSAAQV